ncbi:hypothetical protein J8273_2784 [Carpediemonas membranifera]|uniref:Uncharacterized protein n=1 Tax=Carpediemonas membranifera TaxID=201153 RepID=A0A8J6E0W0_9EUKA|nr:hypothetical protein J8273_2784 [Carpediemonas membranifera]|eukprot:KAG9395589.1 hypothetical protein J8273_2784 [Carpediemonas membranifera]
MEWTISRLETTNERRQKLMQAEDTLLRDDSHRAMIGLITKYSVLAGESAVLFGDLNSRAETSLTSLETLTGNVEALKQTVSKPSFGQVERLAEDPPLDLNYITADTRPLSIEGLLEKCPPMPEFELFDDLMELETPSKIRFSNPDFFFQCWLEEQMAIQEKSKRKQRKSRKRRQKIAAAEPAPPQPAPTPAPPSAPVPPPPPQPGAMAISPNAPPPPPMPRKIMPNPPRVTPAEDTSPPPDMPPARPSHPIPMSTDNLPDVPPPMPPSSPPGGLPPPAPAPMPVDLPQRQTDLRRVSPVTAVWPPAPATRLPSHAAHRTATHRLAASRDPSPARATLAPASSEAASPSSSRDAVHGHAIRTEACAGPRPRLVPGPNQGRKITQACVGHTTDSPASASRPARAWSTTATPARASVQRPKHSCTRPS